MVRQGIAALILLMICSLPAFGQAVPEGTTIAPDNIEPLEYNRPLIEYTFAILFLLLSMGVGFFPSKRVKDA